MNKLKLKKEIKVLEKKLEDKKTELNKFLGYDKWKIKNLGNVDGNNLWKI